jgi:RNA:NAD 2'-phosphotransferase (TPT1/KptA family)
VQAALDLDKNGWINISDAILAVRNSSLVEPAVYCP